MATFESWADSVKRQMVELGMSSFDAGAGITADEWFNHNHAAE